ncbi:hypothetical protein ACGRH2_13285 [Vibrio barjaei]|uniref:Uncharacterized protein n=1 Tax=Vibrio barjaei TaxID=1676683 RepID=A0ABW7IIF7_9VIBR
MNKSEVLFEIFSKKLNSLVNPKFQNVFIKSLFSVGFLLIAPKVIGILARLEIITHNFIVKVEVLESNDTLLSLIGVVFILFSIWLFNNERRMSHETAKILEIKDDDIVVNYYVCESYERLVEINNGDLSNFPIDNAMLLRNSVMSSLNEIISYHSNSYRFANYRGDCYQSVEDYLEVHKDAFEPDRGDGNFSYFQVSRTPNKDELKRIANKDGLLKLMLEHDIDYPISIVGGYEDACCGVNLQEEYIFRQLWVSFLAITNNTDKTLQLNSIKGVVNKTKSFYPLNVAPRINESIDVPNVMLSPGKSILVPLAVLIPPLYSFQRKEISQSKGGGYGERVQIVKNETIYLKNIDDCLVYGDKFDVTNVTFRKGEQIVSSNVREFDLTNMFTYDLHWQCGSCPHLFFLDDNLKYVRELIAECQNRVGVDQFTIPEGVTAFVIAEIEAEVTHISTLEINHDIVTKDLVLRNGDQVTFRVKSGDLVKLTGQYIPNADTNDRVLQGIERNKLVGGFLHANSTSA